MGGRSFDVIYPSEPVQRRHELAGQDAALIWNRITIKKNKKFSKEVKTQFYFASVDEQYWHARSSSFYNGPMVG